MCCYRRNHSFGTITDGQLLILSYSWTKKRTRSCVTISFAWSPNDKYLTRTTSFSFAAMFSFNYFNKRLFQTFTTLVKPLTTPGVSCFWCFLMKKTHTIPSTSFFLIPVAFPRALVISSHSPSVLSTFSALWAWMRLALWGLQKPLLRWSPHQLGSLRA